MTIDSILDAFVLRAKQILAENLLGVYLHGSAVMDCFNPEKSDIDLLVVVGNNPSDDAKRAFMDMVTELTLASSVPAAWPASSAYRISWPA